MTGDWTFRAGRDGITHVTVTVALPRPAADISQAMNQLASVAWIEATEPRHQMHAEPL